MKIGKVIGVTAGVLVVGLSGLVGYPAATATGRLQFPGTPAPALAASKDPAIIERGRYLVHGPAHCSGCHSTADRLHPEQIATEPLHGGLKFAMGPLATRYAKNLTSDPTTGIGALSDAQIARTLRTGVTHDGEISIFMRLSASTLSDEDVIAVLSYLRTLPPVKNVVPPGEFGLLGKMLLTYAPSPLLPNSAPAPAHVPTSETPSIDRGRYLAEHVMLCTGCHSKFNMSTFQTTGPKAGGGDPDPSHGDDSTMEFVAPNLTSHPTGITGRLDEAAFVMRLKAGRTFPSSIMPWENFAATTDTDLKSVYAYLRSLPKVDRDVGPSYRKAGWKPGN